VTGFSCQGGQAPHEGAANAQNMYVHGRGFYVCLHDLEASHGPPER